MLKGIDISSWQDGIDLMRVVSANSLDFVIVKATEGTGFVEEPCDGWVQQCISNNVLWGFYHFARHNSPEAEAEHFYNNCSNYVRHGIPVLDVECGQSDEWVQRFVDRFHGLSGVYPIIYTNSGNIETFQWVQVPKTCGLWVAEWPYSIDNFYDVEYTSGSYPWDFIAIWQFSSEGRLTGYNDPLDLDYAYMTREAWGMYANPDGDQNNENASKEFEDNDVKVTIEFKK